MSYCHCLEGLQYKSITYRLFKPNQPEIESNQPEKSRVHDDDDDGKVKVTYIGGICNGTDEFWPTEEFYVQV